MEQKQSEYKLSMAIYNGIMLALVGILVAATPLTTEIPANQLKMVYISGGGLVVGGLVAIAFGLISKK
jgi:hypothetical protein